MMITITAVDWVTDLGMVIVNHSGGLVAMLMVWERHCVVFTVTLISLSVGDEGVRNGFGSIAIGGLSTSNDAALVWGEVIHIGIRNLAYRSTHDAFDSLEILKKSDGIVVFIPGVTIFTAITTIIRRNFSNCTSVWILVRVLSTILVDL